MKRFLIPLLAALVLPNAVNAEIDSETAQFCLKASDFAGCVETMKRGLDSKRIKDVDDGLRTWTRDTGVIVKMRTNSVRAIKPKGKEYGRYIEYRYSRTGESNSPGSTWRVQVDCDENSANWDNDRAGWFKIDSLDYMLEPGKTYGGFNSRPLSFKVEPAREAQAVFKEFCPQMELLVTEAKERDRINGIEEAKNKSSSTGVKVNCNSPVWKNKPRCI